MWVDLCRHLVVSFGNTFEQNIEDEYYHDQWLHIDGEHKRYHQVICESPTIKKQSVLSDDWVNIWWHGIQLGGKLQAKHYIAHTILQLRQHQISKMVQLHFAQRGNLLMETAQRFSKLLSYQNSRIYLSHLILINPYETVRGVVSTENSRNRMKNFNLEDEKDERHNWYQLLTDKQLVAKLDNSNGENDRDEDKLVSLTVADVYFLLCLCIDAEFDYRESLVKVEDAANAFPTEADDFSDFDNLKGMLAETVLSRKLAGYHLGLEEIKT